MELRVTKDTFAFKIVENPFMKVVTDSGIYLGARGSYSSQETGVMEQLAQTIQFGIVTIVGPDCKVVSVGDGVYFNVHSIEPIPFYEPVWVLHEGNIRAWVKDDGTLAGLIADKEEELKAEAFKTSIALNSKPIAGEPGSGLTLVR